MLSRSKRLRSTVAVLAVLLSASFPALAEVAASDDTIARLVAAARQRDKEAAKEEKAAGERLAAAQQRSMEAARAGSRADVDRAERKALMQVLQAVRNERAALKTILATERYGFPDRIELSRWGERHASRALRQEDEVARAEKAVRERLETTTRFTKLEPAELASAQRELATYEQVREAMRKERATYDLYLAAAGQPSVSEFQERQRARVEREGDHFRRLAERQAAAREAFAALVVSVGVAAAAATILGAPDATPEQKAEAERWLSAERDAARAACIGRGGYFQEGGGTAIGTCSE